MTKSPSLVLAYSAEQYSEKKPVETRSEHKTITTPEGYSLFTQPHSANWYVRFSVNQKQFKKSLKTSSLDLAKPRAMKIYYETIAKAEAGLKVHATTVHDVLNEWIACTKLRQPEQSVVDRFIRGYFSRMDVTKLNSRTIADFMEWRRTYWTEGPGKDLDYVTYSRDGKMVKRPVEHTEPQPSTMNTLQAILSKFLRFCLNRDYIRRIPDFERVKVKTNVRPSFNDAEIIMIERVALADAEQWFNFRNEKYAPQMHKAHVALAFVSVMAFSGLRPTECIRLRWSDLLNFDPEGKTTKSLGKLRIQVHGKSKHRVMVPLDTVEIAFRTLWSVYKETCEREPTKDDYIWVHRNMSQYKDVSRLFDQLLKRLSLKVDYKGDSRDAYSLRHYYITSQLIKGVDIHLLSRNCGTSVAMIEKHYSHVTTEDGAVKLKPENTLI